VGWVHYDIRWTRRACLVFQYGVGDFRWEAGADNMLRSFIENIAYGNKGIVHITGTLAYVLASLADMRGPEPHASDFSVLYKPF
jgi:hypothetical protein